MSEVGKHGVIRSGVVHGEHAQIPTVASVATAANQKHYLSNLIAIYEYDFDDDGGAVGDISLQGKALPGTSYVIKRVWIDVKSAFTSGGSATVAIVIGGVTVLAATAFDNAQYGAGPQIVLDGSADPSAVTNASTNKITVATAALTAGRIFVHVEFEPRVDIS